MDIELHQVPGAWGMPSVSPYCGKLQCWLRMADVPYRVAPVADMLRAPRGKVPFALIDGVRMTDSQRIIEHVGAKLGDPLDGWLTAEQRATGHLVRRTLEDSTYWALVYARWIDDDAWAVYRPVFAALFPPVLREVMPAWLRSGMRKKAAAHGMGLRSREEAHREGIDDLRAVATVLGDRPFLLGDRPCGADATVFAWLDGIVAFPVPTDLRDAVATDPRLLAYVDRVRTRWFPDLGPRSAPGA